MKCITVRDYIAIRFESDNTGAVGYFCSFLYTGDKLIYDGITSEFFFAFMEEDKYGMRVKESY